MYAHIYIYIYTHTCAWTPLYIHVNLSCLPPRTLYGSGAWGVRAHGEGLSARVGQV